MPTLKSVVLLLHRPVLIREWWPVLTGEQLKDQLGALPLGWILPDQKQTTHAPMAFDTVRFVGEAVAVVVADTPGSAADAAESVEVIYDLLPVVVDAEKTMESGGPQIHEDAPTISPGNGR